jgi:hypothetical protein
MKIGADPIAELVRLVGEAGVAIRDKLCDTFGRPARRIPRTAFERFTF